MRILVTIFLFLPFATFSQTVKYACQGCGGTNSGSQANPWTSLATVNSNLASLATGDSVLLRAGDVFTGTIVQDGNRVVIGRYGAGDDPVISGFTTLTSWTNLGGGLYEKTISTGLSTLNMVTIDGVLIPMGRYPNADAANGGYLTVASHTGNTSVTLTGLSGTPSFVGGQVVIRKNQYIIDRGTITAHSSSTLDYTYLADGNDFNPTDGYGAFIQNDVDCLDQFGEWAYDAGTKKITMYFGGSSPTSYTIKASTTEYLATNPNFGVANYYDNITFEGANSYAILNDNGARDIKLTNCTINFSGIDGIHNTNTGIGKLTVTNSNIYNSNSNAITMEGDSIIATGNVIRNSGKYAGMGHSGGGQYIGIRYAGAGSLIENNSVIRTGYNGIHFSQENNITVQYNFVDSACTVKDDGGGIYSYSGTPTANTGRLVYRNIVTHTLGQTNGTPSPDGVGFGIYLDDFVEGVTVRQNTVAYSGLAGFYLHNAKNITLDSNTFYDNVYAQSDYVDDGTDNDMTGLSVQKNLLYSRSSSQYIVTYGNEGSTSLALFGTINNNWYYRPTSPTGLWAIRHAPSFTTQTFAQWKSATTQDAATIGTAPAYVTTTNDSLFLNPTNSVIDVATAYTWTDNNGVEYNTGVVPLGRYQGLLLWRTGEVSPTQQFFRVRGRIIN